MASAFDRQMRGMAGRGQGLPATRTSIFICEVAAEKGPNACKGGVIEMDNDRKGNPIPPSKDACCGGCGQDFVLMTKEWKKKWLLQ